MKYGWYNFKTGEWMPIKCPICGNIDYDYKSYDEEFCDLKRGWKDYDGVYHEKNYKRHRRVRRKHLDRVKQVDQSLVVRYI